MTKRPIRREHRELTPEQKAKYAEMARQVEAEFPPGQPIPSEVFEEAITLGDYWNLRELCSELRRAREARGLTLADVQERTGIDQAQLSRLERGEVLNPTIGTLNRVADAVGCRIGLTLAAETTEANS